MSNTAIPNVGQRLDGGGHKAYFLIPTKRVEEWQSK